MGVLSEKQDVFLDAIDWDESTHKEVSAVLFSFVLCWAMLHCLCRVLCSLCLCA